MSVGLCSHICGLFWKPQFVKHMVPSQNLYLLTKHIFIMSFQGRSELQVWFCVCYSVVLSCLFRCLWILMLTCPITAVCIVVCCLIVLLFHCYFADNVKEMIIFWFHEIKVSVTEILSTLLLKERKMTLTRGSLYCSSKKSVSLYSEMSWILNKLNI